MSVIQSWWRELEFKPWETSHFRAVLTQKIPSLSAHWTTIIIFYQSLQLQHWTNIYAWKKKGVKSRWKNLQNASKPNNYGSKRSWLIAMAMKHVQFLYFLSKVNLKQLILTVQWVHLVCAVINWPYRYI